MKAFKSPLHQLIDDAEFIFSESHSDAKDVIEWLKAMAEVGQSWKPMTADDLWNSKDIMALNSELGLTLNQMTKLVKLIEHYHGIN